MRLERAKELERELFLVVSKVGVLLVVLERELVSKVGVLLVVVFSPLKSGF